LRISTAPAIGAALVAGLPKSLKASAREGRFSEASGRVSAATDSCLAGELASPVPLDWLFGSLARSNPGLGTGLAVWGVGAVVATGNVPAFAGTVTAAGEVPPLGGGAAAAGGWLAATVEGAFAAGGAGGTAFAGTGSVAALAGGG
jgi:hypothetical protein